MRRGKLLCYHVEFFFNDTATTELYTLSLHDALPISAGSPPPARAATPGEPRSACAAPARPRRPGFPLPPPAARSEEHTSELQSQSNLVCRLLLEKKKSSRPIHRFAAELNGTTCDITHRRD